MKVLRNILVGLFVIVAIIFGLFELDAFRHRDNEPPVITADADEITLSTSASNEELMQGLKAYDEYDGDVSSSLVVVSKSHFVTGTTVKVNYAAFDSHNNVGLYSRRVTYSDYKKPRFSISAPLRFVSRNNPDYLGSVTASDLIDGDISSQIKMIAEDSTYSTSDTRSIPITLQVTNSVGDTAEIYVTADIETQYNYNRPAPALSTYLVYTEPGVSIDYYSLLTGIMRGGEVSDFDDVYSADMIMVDTSEVDLHSEGTFEAKYLLMQDGEVIGSTVLFVVVEANDYE